MNKQCNCFFLAFLSVSLLFSPILGVASSSTQEEPATFNCLSKGWPHEMSDLTPDPALIFGTLENGVRYVIMPNHEPKDRVAMFLNIQAGSLHETDEQRGVAHYLEHLLFNGSTNYPPGTLVEYFQTIGMEFGPDTNAHTGYDETVYKLLLPNSEKKNLSEGLLVLADYAGGALLLKEEVERERGVIIAEKRERNSAARRLSKAKNEQTFAKTLIAQRDIIGTDEILETADSALLRQYYERWYRPDNMIVVVVGDASTELVEQLIQQHFSPLKAKTTQPDCPTFGQVAESGIESYYISEPDLGYTEVSIGSAWNTEPYLYNKTEATRQLKEYIAAIMMDYRLDQLTSHENSPLTSAGLYLGKMVGRVGFTAVQARTSAENWKQS
ncbi:MAG: insulinase family protein, partial [Candidatus Electrothrix sp. AR3]|nr:insulinase family protein [Candidatus Electrothrix sp. AR3]